MLVLRLILLSVTSLLVVYADDVTTPIPNDLPVLLTLAPHQDDTDVSGENQRQGRMSLHAELPESKAKREQALRNILAARRRQVLSHRSGDQVRGVVMPRPRGHFSKDQTVDVLEVQESRHTLYVTVPSGVRSEVSEEPDAEPLTKTVPEPSLVEGIDAVTSKRAVPIKQTAEMKDLGYDEARTTIGPEVRHKPSPGISRSGYFSVNRNNSAIRMGKIGEPEARKNNKTVGMSESLYKHFRPVESNVPIEEMTQFLYFGQKLNPETQNTTSSNSLEVTPTLSPIVSSRRRFMKRFSTTTPVAIPRLEEIINEEMNIAVEKPTVERNKIPKLKNVFRSPSASSLYYRKSPVRPADPTIVSNVIGLPDTKNVSDGAERTKETNKTENKSSTKSNPPINETINGHSLGNSTKVDEDSAQTPKPTDPQVAEDNHTLRIVVAETETKMNNDSVNLTAPGGSPPVVLPAQQHVYAYTITNVTRLLRNYSGPGVSTKEEGEQQGPAPAGTPEISDGSSSGIVATRSRSDLSAGPAAEGVTTLEGDLVENSSGDYGLRSDSDAASRGATSTQTPLEVNKTAAKVADSEVGESESHDLGSSLFTDLESRRKNEQENLRDVDQRMLQKSASAVLNQRPSDEPVADRVIGQGTRRRDQPRGYYFRVLKNQVRHTTDDSLSVAKESSMRTVEPNKTTQVLSNITKIANESLQSIHPTDNATRNQNSTVPPEDHQVVNGKRYFEENPQKITPEMPAEQTLRKYSDMSEHHVATPDIQVMDITMTPLDVTTLPQPSEGDGDDKPRSLNQVSMTTRRLEVTSSQSDSSEGGASAMSSDGAPSPVEARSRTDDQKVETAESLPKETIRVQSTMPPSLPTVKPSTLTSVNKDVNTVVSEESVTDVPIIRTTNVTEENRPFGIAEDLSPSEIQQMYRSSNGMTTLKPDVVIPTEQLPGEGQGESEGEGDTEMRLAKFNASLSASENWNGQRTVSVERSPEVKGRNLSDKSSDKDDVLPIMNLYNTSSIFNETSSVANGPSISGTEAQGVILPVVDEEYETSRKDSDSVTMTLHAASSGSVYGGEDVAKNKIHDNVGSPDRNPDPQRLPDSLLNNRDNSTRQKQDQGYRKPVGNPYSNKGNNFTTGTGSNRTRQRPHHQASPYPKNGFNNSVFDPTGNSSHLGSSLLSTSLGESVNVSEVVLKRHEGDNIATQETVAVVSYILATLVVFPIAVGVGLILRRLIMRNRKMLEESDTSSEISCRKDALNLENGDFKTSIEKAITKLPRIQHLCHEAEKPPPPPPPIQESSWEFPRDKLRLQTVLGQGNFGQVWKAEADDLTGHQGTTRLVAVKTVKEGASSREKEDLVRELEIMQQLGNHPNVVTLLGCCTEEEPHYLILEYVMYGKLLAYLRDHRTRQDFYNFSEDSAALTSRDLTVFGYCVARGMEYLASKKIIHRDLAARNVLVDHNKLCKIADFGMSRFSNEDGEVIETRHGRNALPIRWMAPESLIYSLFTTKTDVWSFGILMWEIVTLGSTPYPDMTAREVMRNVQSGYRLERPSHCRSELFRVISRCWQADPDRRPEFQVLRRDLAQLLEDNMNGHYVDLESFASECTD